MYAVGKQRDRGFFTVGLLGNSPFQLQVMPHNGGPNDLKIDVVHRFEGSPEGFAAQKPSGQELVADRLASSSPHGRLEVFVGLAEVVEDNGDSRVLKKGRGVRLGDSEEPEPLFRQQRGSPLVAEQGAEGLQHVESVLQKGPAVLHSIYDNRLFRKDGHSARPRGEARGCRSPCSCGLQGPPFGVPGTPRR